MRKHLKKWMLLAAAVMLTLWQLPVKASDEGRNVLFISSYSLNNPSVAKQIDGIKEGLDSDIYLYYEFMDSRTISSDQYVDQYYQYLEYKYQSLNNIDAIIAGDDDALQMVLRYQSGLFKDIPVIYESVDSSTRAELAHALGMTGVSEHITVQENLDLAVKLYPNASNILAISDESKSGQALSANLKGIKKKYRPAAVTILDTSAHTQAEIISAIQNAGSDTIILYMSFVNDSSGKTYTSAESLQLVVDNTSNPVFTLEWLGQGSLGSISADTEKTGRRAAEMAMQCLNGADPSDLLPEVETDTTAKFDASVIRNYHILRSNLPAGSVYVNDTSRTTQAILVIVLFILVTVILLFLLRRARSEMQKHQKNEDLLQQASEVLKVEAEIDELTQLGNRRTFDRELSRSIEAKRSFVMYLLDIDQFKHINDTYGHVNGDEVLREAGRRLNTMKCRAFVPYRYGGDEFAVMLFTEANEEQIQKGMQILHLFDAPVQNGSQSIPVTASIGSAMFPADADDQNSLIEKADIALYSVKEHGRRSYRSFQSLPPEEMKKKE